MRKERRITTLFRLRVLTRPLAVAVLAAVIQPLATPAGYAGAPQGSRARTAEAGQGTVGRPSKGAPGLQESVAQIMEREARLAALGVTPILEMKPRVGLRPRRKLPQNPASVDAPQWPLPSSEGQPKTTAAQGGLTVQQLAPQTLGTNFTGATLSGINPTFAFPPDSMGAVGPTQYIVMVNNRIVTFDKLGNADNVLNVTTDTFFNSVRNGIRTSDPRIRFDRLSGRWFLIIINVNLPNRILIAVSNTSTITLSTVFTFFFIPIDTTSPPISSSCFLDYPTLGIDANAMYIGGNNFCGSSLASAVFNSTDGYVVQKTSVLGSGPIVVTVFRNLTGTPAGPGPFTPQGVDNYDPAATEGYFIGEDNATFGTLMLRRVSTPATTPMISANIPITVNASSFPLLVPHQGNTRGTNGQLDALDDRLFAAHLRNGRLWTAHNIGVDNTGSATGTPSRNGSRWYELQGIATGSTPSVVQSGTVFTASASNTSDQRFYWIPSVLVTGQGHAAMGFSTAGLNEFANAATVGRLAGDTLGTMQSPLLYTASSTAYNPPSDPGGSSGRRWGDYSYTSLDPNDDMTVWTIQEFCNATNSYGVQIVKLIAPPPATPSSSSPASVPVGQASVQVTITGTSTSGSGFFDPGPGFPNRIAATVSGGVTVNSVTFVDPLTVMLNLNTMGAAAGPQNVMVTNPDGQSATGMAILTLTAATSTALTTSQTPSVFGQSVTFTATVTSGSGTPTGTVQFMDGISNLGSPVPLNTGVAMFVISTLSVGSHSITAVYSGNSTFVGSTSSPLTQVVNQASTSTTVSSAPNPSLLETFVVFTATVTPTPPGGGTPDGSVQFFDGGTIPLGTASLTGGMASLAVSGLSQGTHNITAVYSGSSTYLSSTSPVYVQTVLKKRKGQVVSQ